MARELCSGEHGNGGNVRYVMDSFGRGSERDGYGSGNGRSDEQECVLAVFDYAGPVEHCDGSVCGQFVHGNGHVRVFDYGFADALRKV
jgi:hypothetical protein